MKKTKKEKLAAAARRQREFERIKLVLESAPPEFEILPKDTLKDSFGTPKIATSKKDEELANLTNLSHLPKQLAKIGIITLALILIQILLYTTLL